MTCGLIGCVKAQKGWDKQTGLGSFTAPGTPVTCNVFIAGQILICGGVEAKRRHHGGKTLNSMGPTHRSIRRGFTTLDNTFGHLVGRGPRWYMGASNRGESGPNQDKIWAQFARDFM